MALTAEQDATIDAAARAFHDARRETRAIERETQIYARRSRKVGGAFRQKIIDKVFALAGVDPAAIKERQAANDEADRKFLNDMKLRADANSGTIRRQQQPRIDAFRRSGPRPRVSREKFLGGTIFSTADKILALNGSNVVTNSLGDVLFSTSTGEFNNIIRFYIPHEQWDPWDFVAYFSWTAPASGTLDVLSVVAANGSNMWSSQHGCIEAQVDESVVAYLQVSVNGGLGLSASTGETILTQSWDHFPGCSTDMGMNVVNKTVDLDMQYPVNAGDIILVGVWIEASLWTDEAHGQIDFYNAAKQINVPGVVLTVSGS